jgi:hypothetical protein
MRRASSAPGNLESVLQQIGQLVRNMWLYSVAVIVCYKDSIDLALTNLYQTSDSEVQNSGNPAAIPGMT